MNGDNFKNWLKLYGQAWQDKDEARFSELFSPDVKYYWTPFENPVSGKLDLQNTIKVKFLGEENISFSYDVISFDKNVGVCRWWSKFINTKSQNLTRLDSIFVCEFNKANLCKTFKAWWHKAGE